MKKKPNPAKGRRFMKFAVLSDTHYISEALLYGDDRQESILMRQINRTAIRELKERQDLDVVLITGDLTDAGDVDSHREFAALLSDLKASGKRVYVLTATHDFHFSSAYVTAYGWPVNYTSKPWERPWYRPGSADVKALVKPESRELPEADRAPEIRRVLNMDELWALYSDFGPADAFSVCESAYSYAVKLDDRLWCLMLNNNFRDVDAFLDMSPSYSPACLKWIEEILRQAEKAGAFVFACTHHPLVPPVPAYKIGGTTRNMRRASVVHTLADLGLQLVFSGHTHFANVAFGVSDAGNVLCDVTTPSVNHLPPVYRIVELDGQTKTLTLQNAEITEADDCPVPEKTLCEHYRVRFVEEQRQSIQKLPAPLSGVILGMRVKHFLPLVGRAARLSKAEAAAIREKKIFDLIMDCVVNMQVGDGAYTPDTPEYKFLMGLAAAADSMIAAVPFVGLEKKLQGYTVSQIVEPMLFKNGVPDNESTFRFDTLPETLPTPVFTSRAGDVLIAVLSVFALLVSPLSPAVTAAALPLASLAKKRRLKKQPFAPERY